jgi:hypothetical protein
MVSKIQRDEAEIRCQKAGLFQDLPLGREGGRIIDIQETGGG